MRSQKKNQEEIRLHQDHWKDDLYISNQLAEFVLKTAYHILQLLYIVKEMNRKCVGVGFLSAFGVDVGSVDFVNRCC